MDVIKLFASVLETNYGWLIDEELCLCLRMLVALSLVEIRAFS